jgi:hypothetical protein
MITTAEFAETLAPRTCEALGVCQHPERECPGACELPPKLPGELIDLQDSPAANADLVDLALVVTICLAAAGIGATLVDVWPTYILSVFA